MLIAKEEEQYCKAIQIDGREVGEFKLLFYVREGVGRSDAKPDEVLMTRDEARRAMRTPKEKRKRRM